MATLKLPTRLTITVAWNCDSGIGAFLAQHAAGAEDAGAVDRGVQPAEELLRGGDVGGDAGLVGDVGAEVARVGFAEFGDRGGALVVVDVEQRDLAAVGDQVLGDGEAEAGNAAGDDGADGCRVAWGILDRGKRRFYRTGRRAATATASYRSGR